MTYLAFLYLKRFYEPTDNRYGSQDVNDGTWNGMMGEVISNTVSLALCFVPKFQNVQLDKDRFLGGAGGLLFCVFMSAYLSFN